MFRSVSISDCINGVFSVPPSGTERTGHVLYLLSDPSATGQYGVIDHVCAVYTRCCVVQGCFVGASKNRAVHVHEPRRVIHAGSVCVERGGLFHPGLSLGTGVIMGMHPTPDLL